LLERNKTTIEGLEKKVVTLEEEAAIQKKRIGEINTELEGLGKKSKKLRKKRTCFKTVQNKRKKSFPK